MLTDILDITVEFIHIPTHWQMVQYAMADLTLDPATDIYKCISLNILITQIKNLENI